MGWRSYHIVFSFCFLILTLTSCGEVGTISGGPVDRKAPSPIVEEIDPPMASKNTYPEKITIPFDEFIALNSPGQNIRVVPDDVKLEAKIKKKSLVLTPYSGKWEDTTTYAIYLKRAVKDITEGNDSLMIYVFATGNTIDSLEASIKLVDTYTKKPFANATIGLYEKPLIDDTSKVFPRYIAQTDEKGEGHFKYLKKGPFYAFAFYDENKNNFMDRNEKRGRLHEPVYADTVVDSIPEIKLMPPPPSNVFKVKTNEAIPPATWSLSFNIPKKDSFDIAFLGLEPVGKKWNKEKDSLTVFYGETPRSAKFKAAINYSGKKDTILKKFIFKDPVGYNYKTNLSKGTLLIKDTLTISLNEAIDSIDTNSISIKGKMDEDTTYIYDIPFSTRLISPEAIQIIHDKKFDSVLVNLLPNAINGFNFKQNDTLDINYIIQKQNKVGNLIITFDTIPPYGVLEVMNDKNEVLYNIIIDSLTEVSLEKLQPGDYKFRFIIDTNKDGKWSTGNIFEMREAEEVIFFKEATTIRANWDVNASLDFKSYYESLTPKKSLESEEVPENEDDSQPKEDEKEEPIKEEDD